MAKLRCIQTAVYLFLGSITLTIAAFASPSVATVTSAVPFVLDGHAISSPGVTSFPLVVGDTVASSNGPAVLLFHDGSTVKLSENSSVKLDSAGPTLKVVLLAGALDYKLVPGSNVNVTNLEPVRNQKSVDSAPSAEVPHQHLASVLSSPSFIVSASTGTAGLAATFLDRSSSATPLVAPNPTTTTTATATESARETAHCGLPPISHCW